MSGSFIQAQRVATDLGALVEQLHAAVYREERAARMGDADEDHEAFVARLNAEDALAAGLMAHGVQPFDARAMARAIAR